MALAAHGGLIVTLLHALEARNAKRCVAALCIGGGEATAIECAVPQQDARGPRPSGTLRAQRHNRARIGLRAHHFIDYGGERCLVERLGNARQMRRRGAE